MRGMDDVSDTPSARLRALRLARGFSYREAAAAADVKRSTWQTWEEGADPAAPAAVRAARVLGTTVEAIWGDRPLPPDETVIDRSDPDVVQVVPEAP